MITLLTIIAAIIIIATIVILIAGVIGSAFVAVFGDVIIFALVVWAIVKCTKYFTKSKK